MLLATILSTTLFSLLVTAIPADEKKRPTKPATTSSTCLPTFVTSTILSSPTPTLTYQSCGGHRVQQVPCPAHQICIDDPRQGGCGMACDAPGICVTPDTFCGGFAGFRCKDGKKWCVDDPRDDCDPKHGGADCGGICV